MTTVHLFWFLCVFITNIQAKALFKLKPSNQSFVQDMPQGDLFGSLGTIVDKILSENIRARPPSKSANCNTKLLKFGDEEIKISFYPRGYCSYCCELRKPSRYVRLQFSNKSTGPKTIEIKMLQKKGLLRSVGVNNSSKTIIFLHGFTEHGLGPSPKLIRDVYLSKDEDYNIFLVDWGELTAFPWYPQAVLHTQLVGNVLGKFIRFYSGTGELPISKIHVVGFSLGAHAAGFIGKYLREEKLPRITGLDPALPMFPIHDESERLSKDDAVFVDVIHTDGGKYGYPISIGHADFYPNGGSFVQPGCEASSLAEQKRFEQFVLGSCGHVRAWKLYAESVRNPQAFPATRLNNNKDAQFDTEAYMGFGVNTSSTQGDFYLVTNGEVPYSKLHITTPSVQ